MKKHRTRAELQELSTKIDKKELKNEIQRQLYKKSFFEFVKDVAEVLEPGTRWDWNFHHEYICQRLQEEAERIHKKQKKSRNIIINVPFRSSKTFICSICYPVWCFCVYGDFSFINLSYSAGLSTDASNKVFELINNPFVQDLYQLQMEDHNRSKTDFKLTNGGSRISSGFQGAVLGRGADIIILDDPNHPKDLTPVGLKNTIRTWKDTISTRLNEPEIGLFIIIQQRLHVNDLTGYLLKNHEDKWEHICLPAIANGNINPPYLLLKYQEKLLWKNRFTKKILDDFKTTLGSVMFANQLQQQPVEDEGNIVKRNWIKTITLNELIKLNNDKPIQWEMYVDTAYTANKDNDPSGILLVFKLNNYIYIYKAFNEFLEFPDLIKKIIEIYSKYNCFVIRIEPKASGLSVIQQLKHQTSLPVTQLIAHKDDKETSLRSVSPLIESGRMVMVEDVSNTLVIEQLAQFPRAEHDEFVDLVFYSLISLNQNKFNYGM